MAPPIFRPGGVWSLRRRARLDVFDTTVRQAPDPVIPHALIAQTRGRAGHVWENARGAFPRNLLGFARRTFFPGGFPLVRTLDDSAALAVEGAVSMATANLAAQEQAGERGCQANDRQTDGRARAAKCCSWPCPLSSEIPGRGDFRVGPNVRDSDASAAQQISSVLPAYPRTGFRARLPVTMAATSRRKS